MAGLEASFIGVQPASGPPTTAWEAAGAGFRKQINVHSFVGWTGFEREEYQQIEDELRAAGATPQELNDTGRDFFSSQRQEVMDRLRAKGILKEGLPQDAREFDERVATRVRAYNHPLADQLSRTYGFLPTVAAATGAFAGAAVDPINIATMLIPLAGPTYGILARSLINAGVFAGASVAAEAPLIHGLQQAGVVDNAMDDLAAQAGFGAGLGAALPLLGAGTRAGLRMFKPMLDRHRTRLMLDPNQEVQDAWRSAEVLNEVGQTAPTNDARLHASRVDAVAAAMERDENQPGMAAFRDARTDRPRSPLDIAAEEEARGVLGGRSFRRMPVPEEAAGAGPQPGEPDLFAKMPTLRGVQPEGGLGAIPPSKLALGIPEDIQFRADVQIINERAANAAKLDAKLRDLEATPGVDEGIIAQLRAVRAALDSENKLLNSKRGAAAADRAWAVKTYRSQMLDQLANDQDIGHALIVRAVHDQYPELRALSPMDAEGAAPAAIAQIAHDARLRLIDVLADAQRPGAYERALTRLDVIERDGDLRLGDVPLGDTIPALRAWRDTKELDAASRATGLIEAPPPPPPPPKFEPAAVELETRSAAASIPDQNTKVTFTDPRTGKPVTKSILQIREELLHDDEFERAFEQCLGGASSPGMEK